MDHATRGPSLAADQGKPVLVLIPLYNDWDALGEVLPRLDAALAAQGMVADILVVDDASEVEASTALVRAPFRALRRLEILTLRRNLGHQRAIAIGLAYAQDRLSHDAIVVMDSDGEDDPTDVPRLLQRLHAEEGKKIVFAERTRRSETFSFRMFYILYKFIHYALIGQGVRVGNFSAIPRRRLDSLVVVAELWNHYAAAAFRSRQPRCTIPTRRAKRLRGRSSMNFVGLVTHGLSAISVYGDIVGVRLLALSVVLALLSLTGIVTVVIIRLTTEWAIPGWATLAVGLSLLLLTHAIMMAFVFSFVILGSRHNLTFLPCRDYGYFVGELRAFPQDDQAAIDATASGTGNPQNFGKFHDGE
ncbi:Glycosyltransferase involved in cell wall bisynthesis [Singulisphaera sp. GP187]|uniref:glycosyltransferase n=1 Tax=Singulisphaera sp. GP187 TaxID=1882752 RepID=UPI000929418C|nr:glycosyltransferase [Singulisphaera sp. GP187]SIO55451.1 Glycosyltransferase involved in cell wall bisynthesis [Singulisphaera sp. GP187]